MKIEFKQHSSVAANLIMEIGDANIKSDPTFYNTNSKEWEIDHDTIEQFVRVAREMNQFNNKTDLDFIREIAQAFLNESQREELIEMLQTA